MNPRLQDLLHEVSDGLLVLAPDGRIRFLNETGLRLFGQHPGEALREPVLLRLIESVRHGYTSTPSRTEIDAPGQASRPDRLRVTLLPSPAGEGYLLVARNVTEEQFYRSTIANLMDLINHELRTPMQTLSMSVQLIMDELQEIGEEQARVRPLADTAISAGVRLTEKLQKLIELAQLFPGERLVEEERIEPVDLVEEVASGLRELARERGIRVCLAGFSSSLPTVFGSRAWLRRALHELLENAVRHGRNTSVLISARAHDHRVTLVISDFGPEMGRHLHSRIFLPFHKGANADNVDGLGLGLPLAQRIIEMHGGRVRLSDEEGGKLGFSIELPAGAPHRTQDDIQVRQAYLYARDLAVLLRRAQKGIEAGAASRNMERRAMHDE